MLKKIQLQLTIPEQLDGSRLDAALAELHPEYSRGLYASWIAAGAVLVEGQARRKKDKVFAGENVAVNAEIAEACDWQAQARELNIIYEDADIIVLNKPDNLVVHPGAGIANGTLVNALLHAYPELQQLPRGGIVHRLDKDTTGLMVVARSLTAHTKLVAALQVHDVVREYEAVCNGVITAGGTVNEPIGRHPKHRTKMAVVTNGKPAVTHYRLLRQFAAHTHISVQLETGRTHQIRVHMAHLGYPLLGDKTYGGRAKYPKQAGTALRESIDNFSRQALHARRLSFIHPTTQENCQFEAPLPADMQHLLITLKEG